MFKFGGKVFEVKKDHRVVSSNTLYLEGNAGFFRLLMKRIFDPYAVSPFDKKLIYIISNVL